MEIIPGVYCMGNRKGGQVRAFLLDDGHGLTLVDTLFEADARLVLEEIKSAGRRIEDLKRIVVTHAHRAHLGGLAALKRLSGAPVYSHEWETDIIMGERKPPQVSFLPVRPYRTYIYQLGVNLNIGAHRPCPVDHVVRDGDQIGPLLVIHTPGHTPGHLSYLWPERGLLITGDIVSTWPEFAPGWLGFALDKQKLCESMRHLTTFKPRVLAVGHGNPMLQVDEERLDTLVQTAEQWARA